MLEDYSRRGRMTTDEDTETTILKVLKSLVIGSGQMGYSKTILKLRTDKSRVYAGAEKKGEAITIDTEIVKQAHDLKDSS